MGQLIHIMMVAKAISPKPPSGLIKYLEVIFDCLQLWNRPKMCHKMIVSTKIMCVECFKNK